jgi:triacylglycerol lipase
MTRTAVVILHGMGRTRWSMRKPAKALSEAGYHVVNLGYPSTSQHHGIQDLAGDFVSQAVARCDSNQPIHFVTHSLGGILLRMYLQQHKLPVGSRAVMLAPPNHGSEVAESLRGWFLYRWLMGRPGQQLGTGVESIPLSLKAIEMEIGIITGNRSIEPWFSRMLTGENDGKVSVASARLPEARDFLVVPQSHSFIMQNERVIKQLVHFIQQGCFTAAQPLGWRC